MLIPRRIVWTVGVTAILVVIVAVLIALMFEHARDGLYRAECKNNVKAIAMALHNYHDAYDCLPPAYTTNNEGRPAHSWRVLILPFFEDDVLTTLHGRYKFDEPWDGPNNSKLADQIPGIYTCPGFEHHFKQHGLQAPNVKRLANYVAITGPHTVFEGTGSLAVKMIPDGTSSTLMIAETSNRSVHWMQPDDISVDEFIADLQQTESPNYAVHLGGGLHVGFADGSMRFIRSNTLIEILRAICTIDGGEKIPDL